MSLHLEQSSRGQDKKYLQRFEAVKTPAFMRILFITCKTFSCTIFLGKWIAGFRAFKLMVKLTSQQLFSGYHPDFQRLAVRNKLIFEANLSLIF